MYYTMDIDKQLKAYYVIIVTNKFPHSIYLLSIQEIIIKTTAELSTHFYTTMLLIRLMILVLVLCLDINTLVYE